MVDKLKMLVIDDTGIQNGKYDITNKDPKASVGIRERFEDQLDVDVALTYNSGVIRDETKWAEEMLDRTQYDIIVLDHQFPGQNMHGDEILAKVRSHPTNQEAFVIGNSGCYRDQRAGVEEFVLEELEYLKTSKGRKVTERGFDAVTPGDGEKLFELVEAYLGSK
jgi:CheY-like chemotaxis protein